MLENRVALALLPHAERRALRTLAAWCRRSDDIAHGSEPAAERRKAFDAWRFELDGALAGRDGEVHAPEVRALVPVLGRYPIPHGLLVERLARVEMDLEAKAFASVAELEKYAFRGASVEALVCIAVLGYSDARAHPCAVSLGLATELAHVVAALATDLANGRVRLPATDLARHGVTREELLASRDSPALRAAAAETAQRARAHLADARALFPRADRRSLFPLAASASVVGRLLDRVAGAGGSDASRPARVPLAVESWVAGLAWARSRLAPRPPAPLTRGGSSS